MDPKTPALPICPNCDGAGTVALDNETDEGIPCPICGGTGTLAPKD
jgi:DnaJ-class molecular chaperone